MCFQIDDEEWNVDREAEERKENPNVSIEEFRDPNGHKYIFVCDGTCEVCNQRDGQ